MYCFIENKIPHIINIENFNKIGGKALGIEVLKFLSLKINDIKTPPSFFILKDSFIDEIKNIDTTKNIKYSYKISTCNDDFSNDSIRGKNSSNARSIQLNIENLNEIYNLINVLEYKSIIFQEYVENGECFFILHKEKKKIVIEILIEDITYIFICSNKEILSFESSSLDYIEDAKLYVNQILKLIELTQKIYNIVGFEFNIEGFFTPHYFFLIQFRPIPNDFHINNENQILPSIKEKIYRTNFVYNNFSIDLSIYTIVSIYDVHHIIKENTKDQKLLVCINYTKKLPLEIPFIKNKIENKIYCLVINLNVGFFLSHSAKHIPLSLEHREYLYCFSFPKKEDIEFIINHCIALSDGEQLILIKKGNNNE